MILVTGATGFVGNAVLQRLLEEDQSRRVAVAVRRDGQKWPLRVLHRVTGDLESVSDWSVALDGVSAVIHCAARVHVMADTAANPLDEFRRVNVHGTLNLARQAVAAGVLRFVFVSSIGVNGAETFQNPFTDQDQAAPHSPYALSKYEAELGLQALAAETGMEVVIIRPPLVYGPGAPGNFASLLRWVHRGLPLPLGSVHNQRSFVALENLVSLVLLCADRERSRLAANQVFVVADGEDVSTSTLLRKVARAAGRPSRLLPVPASWLRAWARLFGKREVADRLLGNLQVDATKARTLLGWRPVVTMDEQLAKMFEQKD